MDRYFLKHLFFTVLNLLYNVRHRFKKFESKIYKKCSKKLFGVSEIMLIVTTCPNDKMVFSAWAVEDNLCAIDDSLMSLFWVLFYEWIMKVQ